MASKGAQAVTGLMRPSPQDVAREKRYQAESDLRTLTEAQTIQRDSARMREVKRCAQEQMKSLQGVAGAKRSK